VVDRACPARLAQAQLWGRERATGGRFLGGAWFGARRERQSVTATQSCLRVAIGEDGGATAGVVDRLMSTKPEARFAFIQERAPYADGLDI